MQTPGESTRYRFGPLERRGLIAGWRGGQIATVATGLVVGVGLLRARPDPLGLGVVVALLAMSLTIACWPVRGRTLEQWAPVMWRWLADSKGGRTRVHARPIAGEWSGTTAPRTPTRVPDQVGAGGALAGLSLLGQDAAGGGRRAGILRDARARTFTAALSVRGGTFALLEGAEQARRVASWAGVLAGLAREGSAVHRLQWVERSLPDDGGGMDRYLYDEIELDPSSPQVQSYRGLLRGAAPVTQRHEILVALSIRAVGRRDGRARRHTQSEESASALLGRELFALERQLASADIEVDGPLSRRALAHSLRMAVADHPREVEGDDGASWPWPVATETRWSCVRADGTWHATYWVVEWPRVDVGPDFLSPLLLQTTARRTLSLTMEPVSPLKAVREVEHARTADLAEAELRRRGGFTKTARRRREEEVVARREMELADGHAQYRFAGYLTVSACTLAALEESCGQVEQAAAQSRLELRRLYGEQDRAFTYTLPLCRGLS